MSLNVLLTGMAVAIVLVDLTWRSWTMKVMSRFERPTRGDDKCRAEVAQRQELDVKRIFFHCSRQRVDTKTRVDLSISQ